MKRASYALLALVMAAAISACGSKKEEEPVAEQTVAEAEQALQENAPDAAAQAEEAAKEEAAKEEAAKSQAQPKPEAVPEPASPEESDVIEVASKTPKWPAALHEKTYHYVFEFPNITRDQCLALKNCLAGNQIEYTFKKL